MAKACKTIFVYVKTCCEKRIKVTVLLVSISDSEKIINCGQTQTIGLVS